MTGNDLLDAWMPDLVSLEKWKLDDPTYRRYGWEALVVPDDCIYVKERMEQIGMRFNERYAFRMFNAETLERWQIRLQNRFDEVVHRWDRAYMLYGQNKTRMDTDLVKGTRTMTEGESQLSGADTSVGNSDSRSVDTPDTALNDDDRYADRRTKSDSTNTVSYGRRDQTSGTIVSEESGVMVENVNRAIYAWEDIDTEFVKDFENNFLNIFWY